MEDSVTLNLTLRTLLKMLTEVSQLARCQQLFCHYLEAFLIHRKDSSQAQH